ncbi:hypothetical protein RVF83_10940 [Gordonia rubripertincta]|uniref:Uncharacterized protein n=2 Tax=Gordonia rubripertincta TaxID=36822 RepID=A0AAW6RDN0_GORRU|nr:hypothetical protein [Gordonia rubripertincta]MDG6782703.1 hypothetical protein [Gordonia rubripertincta]GAB86817.1 hypothetical protein GORBP_081_00990 [Gordonia rubripertincta NBRC 101908]
MTESRHIVVPDVSLFDAGVHNVESSNHFAREAYTLPISAADAGTPQSRARHRRTRQSEARRLRAWLTTPRETRLAFRYLATLGAAMLAFAPTLLMTVDASMEGSPTAYLLLVPVWSLLIAFGLDSGSGRQINDSEFDRILVVVVGGGLALVAMLVIPRVPAVAAFWRADAIPMLIWAFASSIVIFGIRRVVSDYRVWLFVLVCFPPNFLLAGQVLGGTTTVIGALTVALAAIAIYLSLRSVGWRFAVGAALASAGAGVAMVFWFADRPALAYTVPAGVVTVAAMVVRLRCGHATPSTVALPKHSIATHAVTWVAALGILVLAPHPPTLLAPNAVTATADWVAELRGDGLIVADPQIFDWGPRVMGSGGDVRRYRITLPLRTGVSDGGLTTAYVDVYTTAERGRFANYRRGIWYQTVPPADISSQPASADAVHTRIGSIANTVDAVRTADDSLWTARFWAWEVQTPHGPRSQAVYLLANQDPRAADVVEPQPPSYSTTVVEPIEWLIRGGDRRPADQGSAVDAVDTALTGLAWQIVRSSESTPR